MHAPRSRPAAVRGRRAATHATVRPRGLLRWLRSYVLEQVLALSYQLEGANLFLAYRQFFDEVCAHIISASRRIGNHDLAFRGDGDFGLDNVLVPVARRSRHIAREPEIFQSRQRDIV